MIQVKDQVVLYERVQEEYDEFIEQLVQEGVLSCEQLHELTLKTLIFKLIVNECYTQQELKNLIQENEVLELLYGLVRYKC